MIVRASHRRGVAHSEPAGGTLEPSRLLDKSQWSTLPKVQRCPTCGASNADPAKFCQECGARLSAPGEARRRPITALFCDLVGSTELGDLLDAERLRKVLDRYFGAMRSAIERHGGTVEKFIGDAVVGAFGVPVAHEDDTLRAARAALDMRQAAAEIDAEIDDPNVRVRVRIAINCGEALADEAAAAEGRIAGDVFSTAARLQEVAEPGEVLVTGAAENMLRERLEMDRVSPLELKGKTGHVEAHRIVRLRPELARIETPLVGRERQLTALHDALDDAIDARACVLVTILAPAGIGKSRLGKAFGDAVHGRATVLVGQTPSYGEGVTFAPLAELLAQAAGHPTGEAQTVAAALRKRLAAQPDGAAVGDRIAQVLGVGEALAADTSWAVRRLLEVLASEQPLVVVIEDLQWAESPLLDLVDSVIERLHGPALVLCLARPELLEQRPTWAAGKPRAITTTLSPLPPDDARRMGEFLLGEQTPRAIVERVCDTAEGNPLYLEQLTSMLADQGLFVDGHWIGSDDADLEIPPTLQALLASRLDRLDTASRAILERAAIEGRRFRTAALRALAPEMSSEDLESALASLDRKGLVQPEDEAGGRWRFAHALVLEAAYRGLSKELRANLHERLANWMLEEDADRPDVDESVARHLERALHLQEELGARDDRSAHLAERAGELFATAGSRAFEALDLITARDLLGRAETLLPERSPRRLDLLPNLGVALTETGRPAETEALLTKAIDQARGAGSERNALRATIQLLSNRIYRSPSVAEIESAVTEARIAAEALEALDDNVGLAEAAIALEYLEFMTGRAERAHEWTFRAWGLALSAGRTREAAQAAADIVGYAVMGPLPFDGFASTARELLAGSDAVSQSSGHALRAIAALAHGEASGFYEHEGRWRDVVGRHGLSWLGAAHALVIAGVEIWVGNAEAGERRLRQARDILTSLGDIWWVATLDSSLCAAVSAQNLPREFLRLADALEGSATDAEAAARRGLELAESTDFTLDHADALLVLADALEARGLREDAATARNDAVAKLRAKGNLAAVAHFGG